MKELLKKLTKFRKYRLVYRKSFDLTIYLFQGGRWELGITYDINGDPLLCINFIFIHFELTFYEEYSSGD